jgi:hypothetical protein
MAAVAAALAAAAARAKQQAWAEERDIQRLMVMVADAQLRKVAAKTKVLAEMTQVRHSAHPKREAGLVKQSCMCTNCMHTAGGACVSASCACLHHAHTAWLRLFACVPLH